MVRRVFRELKEKDAIFDLPARHFFLGAPGKDYSVTFHGKRASTPFGPAAGPHSQLAQNIVLSWLAGGRIMELKTVQVLDELKIPRPCIDMRNVGYNVEWSQELKLEESLEEYVKASMLIEILKASGKLALAEGMTDTIFDMSVGYDLKGIESDRVQAFINGMKDASSLIERLRKEIPEEYKQYRDLNFNACISNTLTLSTFHGCPPEEIEKIIDYLLREHGLHCIIKLNPTLLGPVELRRLMGEVLGYKDIHTPDAAFEKDAKWEQAMGFVERLKSTAEDLGLGFGVKFNNTLIVKNKGDGFLPASEKEMYLSGPPLHVVGIQLVQKFRKRFGDAIPISFSAGIDKLNFADAVSLGLVPITVCSDLLKPGGYARARGYFEELGKRMDEAGASDIARFSAERMSNTEAYAAAVLKNPRYRAEKNAQPPKKMDSRLELFDCLTCDKCVPVCPNDANFAYDLAKEKIPIVKLRRTNGAWVAREEGVLEFSKKHQLANYVDFCNECGNCDIFCPEEGGPYALKPRFFGSLALFKEMEEREGLYVEKEGDRVVVHGRFKNKEFKLVLAGEEARFSGEDFSLSFRADAPAKTAEGDGSGEVDLTYFHIMNRLQSAVLADTQVNYINT